VGHFTITNNGRADLLLDRFSTSCSCAGVERELDGQVNRVESVSIPPRGQVDLIVRVAVGVPSGERQLVQVGFSTNDPLRPVGVIGVVVPRVKGGVCILPNAALFGEVRVGATARRVVDLYDNRQPGRRIDVVRSLEPERFEARLLPVREEESGMTHERGGRLMAHLEIVAKTLKPGSLNGRIEVSLAGEAREPDSITVFGEVVQDIECRPSTLVLPRRTGEHLVYSGQMRLRHRDGDAVRLEVESLPAGISGRLRQTSQGEFPWLLDLECSPAQPAFSGERTVRLRVMRGSAESYVSVPIRLTSAPTPEDP
jgi:hypothetical protein